MTTLAVGLIQGIIYILSSAKNYSVLVSSCCRFLLRLVLSFYICAMNLYLSLSAKTEVSCMKQEGKSSLLMYLENHNYNLKRILPASQ